MRRSIGIFYLMQFSRSEFPDSKNRDWRLAIAVEYGTGKEARD